MSLLPDFLTSKLPDRLTSSLHGRLDDQRHALDFFLRLAPHQDERPPAVAPDGSAVPENLDDFLLPRPRCREHEQRERLAVMAIHDVGEPAVAIHAEQRSNELEVARGGGRWNVHSPAES